MADSRRTVWMVGACAAAAALAGCQPRQTVVRYKPFLTTVPGAVHNTAPVLKGRERAAMSASPSSMVTDQQATPGAEFGEVGPDGEKRTLLAIEHRDGSKTLILKSISQLMANLERTLDSGDDALLLDQVVSRQTRDYYASQGRDEAEIASYLHRNRRAIAQLFSWMPFAERSPAVYMEKTGKRDFRLRLTGQARKHSALTELWVTMEGGDWKLVWVK